MTVVILDLWYVLPVLEPPWGQSSCVGGVVKLVKWTVNVQTR